MFNDRKMAVREEQKVVESAVSFPCWVDDGLVLIYPRFNKSIIRLASCSVVMPNLKLKH